MPDKSLDQVIEEARNAKCEYRVAAAKARLIEKELEELKIKMEHSSQAYSAAVWMIHEMTRNQNMCKPDQDVTMHIIVPAQTE
jgi:hypothetical protein